MYGGDLGKMFVGMIVAAALFGAAVVGVLVWLVPLVWSWIKPWLHAVTAGGA